MLLSESTSVCIYTSGFYRLNNQKKNIEKEKQFFNFRIKKPEALIFLKNISLLSSIMYVLDTVLMLGKDTVTKAPLIKESI